MKENYNVGEAYYFFGYYDKKNDGMYEIIQKAGFITTFKDHSPALITKKKGNVDTDIVLAIMIKLIDEPKLDRVILVSGDGDYKKLVDYLIKKGRFKKILFPNKKYSSSLYDELGSECFDYLENIKTHIEKK